MDDDFGVQDELIENLMSKLDAFLVKAEDVCKDLDTQEKRDVVMGVADNLIEQVKARIRQDQEKPEQEIVDAELKVTQFVYDYLDKKLSPLSK